jgi:hypothetical protein
MLVPETRRGFLQARERTLKLGGVSGLRDLTKKLRLHCSGWKI